MRAGKSKLAKRCSEESEKTVTTLMGETRHNDSERSNSNKKQMEQICMQSER